MLNLAARWFFSLAFACAAMSCAPGHAAGEPALTRLADSIFRLEAHDAGGQTRYGSAVLVAQATLVTNCHVVRDAWDIRVITRLVPERGQLIRADIERDVCLLHVPGLTGTVVAFGDTTSKKEGDTIVAIGFAKGADMSVTQGHIEGLFTYKGRGRVVQGSATFSPGKSGGGLFDRDDKLVGVLTFKCLAGGPFHFAVPVEWVSTLMKNRAGRTSDELQTPFWKRRGDAQPAFVRAASLFASGKCEALSSLATTWQARDPASKDALFFARRAWRCAAAQRNPGVWEK